MTGTIQENIRGKSSADLNAYRWTCPICGSSNVGYPGGRDPNFSALAALQSHIRTVDGDGHGPQYELPDQWSRDELDTHVDLLDELVSDEPLDE